MTFISRTALRMRRVFMRPVARANALFHQFFAARPATKRVLLVILLFGIPLVFAHLILSTLAPLVTAQLAMLLMGTFLGMGAERASTDWDDFFALPPLSAFAVWRWYPIERKRFSAAIGAILVLWIFSFLWRAL